MAEKKWLIYNDFKKKINNVNDNIFYSSVL